MNEFTSDYVGLDVHKDSIAVAVARWGRGGPEYRGEIEHTPAAVQKLVKQLSPDGEVLSFCYDAGPCGYASATGSGPASYSLPSIPTL